MSDFWAKRLQQAQPVQQPVQQPAPQQRNVAWWATPAAPQQVTPQAPQQVAPQGYGSETPPGSESSFGELLRQGDYTTTKAQSLRDSEPCPDCGSPNFISPQGHPNAMKQCFNCGYNPRFQQSMSGLSGTGQNIPVQAARVQQGNTRPANFGQVIDHV